MPQGAERKQLLNAARALLKKSASYAFVVLLLKSDGAWAVGRLEPETSGPPVWVAWRNQSKGGWKAIWSSNAAKPDVGAIHAIDSRFPGALAKIRMVTVPSVDELRQSLLRAHPDWDVYQKDWDRKVSDAINAALRSRGLFGSGSEKFDETAPGTVQSPRAGSRVPEGTKVVWSSSYGG